MDDQHAASEVGVRDVACHERNAREDHAQGERPAARQRRDRQRQPVVRERQPVRASGGPCRGLHTSDERFEDYLCHGRLTRRSLSSKSRDRRP